MENLTQDKQTDKFYRNHAELSLIQKEQIVKFLVKERMTNYGYDWKEFRRMQAKRGRLRFALAHADIYKLHWLEIGISRFRFVGGNLRDYVVGQSRNEEITRIMEVLLTGECKW